MNNIKNIIIAIIFIIISPVSSFAQLYGYNPQLISKDVIHQPGVLYSIKEDMLKKERELYLKLHPLTKTNTNPNFDNDYSKCTKKFRDTMNDTTRSHMQGSTVYISCQGYAYHKNRNCPALSPNRATLHIIRPVNIKMAIIRRYVICKECGAPLKEEASKYK